MTPLQKIDHDAWLLDAEEFDTVACPCCRGRGCGACQRTGGVSPEAAAVLRELLSMEGDCDD